MEKTAVRQIIEALEEIKRTKCTTLKEVIFFDGVLSVIESEGFEKIEREQIIKAFWKGDNTDCTTEQNSYDFAKKYYDLTYRKPTGYLDDNGEPIFVGDILESEWKYQVVVQESEDGDFYGKLICEDSHSCKDIPYSLNEGAGHVKIKLMDYESRCV